MYTNNNGLTWLDMDTDQKIIELARRMNYAFELRTRDNEDRFWCLADYAPQWMSDIIREVHDSVWPDDYIYRWIQDTVDALANIYDIRYIDDTLYNIEGDIYNDKLLLWLQRGTNSTDYMERVLSEGIVDTASYGFFDHVMSAQHEQIIETAQSVYNELKWLVNNPDFNPQPEAIYKNADNSIDEYYQKWHEYIVDNPFDFEQIEDNQTSEFLLDLEV